jgi:hypothetical protein
LVLTAPRLKGCLLQEFISELRPPIGFFDWHPATRRQYVINLDAPNEITASNGETRIIGVGEIILIEDVHGKGHLSQAVGKMRRSVMARID